MMPRLLTGAASSKPPVVSTPLLKMRRLATDETPGVSPALSSIAAEKDSTYNVEDDFYLPNTTTSAASSEQSSSINQQNKYIVFQSSLWQLFEDCSLCRSKCEIHSSTQGSLLRVHQQCTNSRCDFSRQWDSQPMVQNTPAGNIMMSAAILFCGASYSKTLRIFDTIGLVSISESNFKKHSRKYLQPTVYQVWKTEQEKLFHCLQSMSGKLEIGGDGRADSPGHCAKYGSYTTLETRINKVIDVQLVQSNEVGGSYHMELAGLERSMELLKANGLIPGVVVTDRHPSVQKWMRDNLPETVHYYDLWHVAKGLTKKMERWKVYQNRGVVNWFMTGYVGSVITCVGVRQVLKVSLVKLWLLNGCQLCDTYRTFMTDILSCSTVVHIPSWSTNANGSNHTHLPSKSFQHC